MKKLAIILGFLSFNLTAQKITIEVFTEETCSKHKLVSVKECLNNPDATWGIEDHYRLLELDLDAKTFISYIKDLEISQTQLVAAGSGVIEITNIARNAMMIKFDHPTSNYGIYIDKSTTPVTVASYLIYDNGLLVEKYIDFKIK